MVLDNIFSDTVFLIFSENIDDDTYLNNKDI